MTDPKTTSDLETQAQALGKIILRELDTGGSDYMQVRRKIAKLSGVPAMAITFDEHIEIIEKQMERLKRLEAAYAA